MSRGKLASAAVVSACALLAITGASSAAAAPKAKAKVSVVNRTFQLPDNGTGFGLGEASPPCPGNRTLIGGGSRSTPGIALTTNIELVSSGPAGNAWNTLFDNNTATAQTVLSDAICLKNKLNVIGGDEGIVRPKVKQVTIPFALPPQGTNNGVAEIDVPCPKGYTVVSGGPRVISGTPGTTSNEITAFESASNGNSWHSRYDNDSAVGANAEASALCLKNKSKVKAGEDGKAVSRVEEVERTVALPPQGTDNGVAQFDVPCPKGTKLVGGGGRHLPGSPLATPIELFESGPNGDSWHVRFNNDDAVAQTVLVSASCLKQNLKVK